MTEGSMIRQVGRSASVFSKINIWECDRCREQWTTPTEIAQCPYCHSAWADQVKRQVPFSLPRTWKPKL